MRDMSKAFAELERHARALTVEEKVRSAASLSKSSTLPPIPTLNSYGLGGPTSRK